ncbi:response regulator [Microcoleus sp. T3_B1]|uniref:response regulator n=1 Tax=Microcoleus sp. T3_B1 TaxID=3055425 RepID=UPI002FD4E1E0
MKVLLVEDDEVLADLLRRSLVAQHYLVEMAADGQAGWELAEVFEYDLIILDLMLPKLDGISFCQQLRAEGKHNARSLNCKTPILLMTAEDATTNRVAGLDAGADDYIGLAE